MHFQHCFNFMGVLSGGIELMTIQLGCLYRWGSLMVFVQVADPYK